MTHTVVLKCACEHLYQDCRYGHNMRLHNMCTKEEGTYRCTCCGHVRLKAAAVYKPKVEIEEKEDEKVSWKRFGPKKKKKNK